MQACESPRRTQFSQGLARLHLSLWARALSTRGAHGWLVGRAPTCGFGTARTRVESGCAS